MRLVGAGEGPGTKVTMEYMATDGLSGTATGLLGGPAPSSKRSQRVFQTRSEWSRAFGSLASALESRRDLMFSLRQGQIPAARPPVTEKGGFIPGRGSGGGRRERPTGVVASRNGSRNIQRLKGSS